MNIDKKDSVVNQYSSVILSLKSMNTPSFVRSEWSRVRIVLGFTLVELIVVIAILSILGTIGFVQIQGFSSNAKDSVKITDLNQINTALNLATELNQPFSLTGLKPITYKAFPQDVTVYIGELGNNIPGLNNPSVDPFTKKPYIIGIYTGGNGGISRQAQVGSVLENKKGDSLLAFTEVAYAAGQFAPGGVPVQKLVGTYNPFNISGISGLIPRMALENYEDFKKTEFYSSGSIIYGGAWGNFYNNYIFAMNGLPLTQIAGYTNTGTLLYESFENIKAEVTLLSGFKVNNYKAYPACVSKSASLTLSYEANTSYIDQVQTTDCTVDTSIGVNSQSSFYLKWLRDSSGGDGQYTYLMIDPTKKYKYSFDVKGRLNNLVNGGKLNTNFLCYKKDSTGAIAYIGGSSFLVTLDPNTFTRISAYVNAPDPSGNNLSVILPGGITESTSCIFYRANGPKAGDELWFDNFIINEIL